MLSEVGRGADGAEEYLKFLVCQIDFVLNIGTFPRLFLALQTASIKTLKSVQKAFENVIKYA